MPQIITPFLAHPLSPVTTCYGIEARSLSVIVGVIEV